MENFEQLGLFYLGKEIAGGDGQDGSLVLYPSSNLSTHALCVGMTGSGKTGLCIDLLEEAAIDGIPALIIDPKGDMANLALRFPDYRPEDFLPWVTEDEARQKNLTREDLAQDLANNWKRGIESWGQTGDRIRLMDQNSELCVYTPASEAAEPLSLLAGLDAPSPELLQDYNTMANLVAGTVSSLLSLLEIEADPLQSPEHILLSNIFQQVWHQGQNLNLASLIGYIQNPPFSTVGVMDLEAFYPQAERQKLAQRFNNLLASPGFAPWLHGHPLDIDRMLYNDQGKAKVSIISIAHLGDKERMFFVSLFLNRLLAWTRSQTGSQSLRAILYMDEIFGYFPPVANPPSKRPLLTLLKQARAYGLGIVLSTQNPMDLDYKGLGNIGTWWIGRLQTENDRARLLDGMQDAVSTSGEVFSRQELDQLIAGLGKREFLMNNVHSRDITKFESRFALSYLKGPMSLAELKKVKEMGLYTRPSEISYGSLEPGFTPGIPGLGQEAQPASNIDSPNVQASSPAYPGTMGQEIPAGQSAVRPEGIPSSPAVSSYQVNLSEQAALAAIPKGIPSYFMPASGPVGRYVPRLGAFTDITYYDKSTGDVENIMEFRLAEYFDSAIPVRWEESQVLDFSPDDLLAHGQEGAEFVPLPADMQNKTSYTSWEKSLVDYLYRNHKLIRYENKARARSRADEDERSFRIRLDRESREQREYAIESLRQKYEKRLDTQAERIRKAEQQLEKRADMREDAKRQTAITAASSVLNALLGKKKLSSGTLGRATTATKSASRVDRLGSDVERAQDTLNQYQEDYEKLVQQMEADLANLEQSLSQEHLEVYEVELKPLKRDIRVRFFGVVWEPRP